MTPSIAVLDTNIWLDWLVFRDPCVATLQAAHKQGQLILPTHLSIREELLDVLSRPIFAKPLAKHAQTMSDIAGQFDALCTVHDLAPRCPSLVCKDKDDQVFLDLAVHCKADFLVSKDKQVLKLANRAQRLHNLVIFSPSALTSEERIAKLLKQC